MKRQRYFHRNARSKFIKKNAVGYHTSGVGLTTIPELAARILSAFREKAKSKGSREISATHLYEEFAGVGSHDMIQAAIRYLVDRDFIAPNSYSLTAKGMVKKIDTENKKR